MSSWKEDALTKPYISPSLFLPPVNTFKNYIRYESQGGWGAHHLVINIKIDPPSYIELLQRGNVRKNQYYKIRSRKISEIDIESIKNQLKHIDSLPEKLDLYYSTLDGDMQSIIYKLENKSFYTFWTDLGQPKKSIPKNPYQETIKLFELELFKFAGIPDSKRNFIIEKISNSKDSIRVYPTLDHYWYTKKLTLELNDSTYNLFQEIPEINLHIRDTSKIFNGMIIKEERWDGSIKEL